MAKTLAKLELLSLYKKMLLGRMAEEAIMTEYFKDEMKTPVHLGLGQEAIVAGVVQSLKAGTRYFGTYRNHNLFLALSEDTDSFFCELFGKANGIAKGKAGSMHLSHPEHGLILTSAVVGTTIPVAAGAAFANRYLGKKDSMVAVFFGDGAIEEGVFWETLNFSVLKKLNILLVCEDNDFAIHTPKKDRQAYINFRQIIEGYGVHYEDGKGYHAEHVVTATQNVLEKMKQSPGPGLLRLEYYRFLQHVGPLGDFDAGYRPKPPSMDAIDPVKNMEASLAEIGVNPTEVAAIKDGLTAKIQASIALARKSPFPDSSELMTDILATDSLTKEQR